MISEQEPNAQSSDTAVFAYWDVLRRWLWLIALAALVAGGTAFAVSYWTVKPIYQATTRLIVQPSTTTSGTSYIDVLAGQHVATTYAEMLKSRSLLWSALAAMGYQSEEIPYHKLTVEPVADTEMIEITVESTDAQFAADLANTLAQTFIEENQIGEVKQSRYQLYLGSLAQRKLPKRCPDQILNIKQFGEVFQPFPEFSLRDPVYVSDELITVNRRKVPDGQGEKAALAGEIGDRSEEFFLPLGWHRAENRDRTAVGIENPRQDFEQRGLPGPVGTDHSDHLSPFH